MAAPADPVAIVGLAGRFSGSASSPTKLWELISKGRTSLSEVPRDRYNIDAFYHPSAERIGTHNARGGYFIKDDLATFDAPFFKVTAQEAEAMDPNQRLILEVSYEALENAGLTMANIAGSKTGCYMAVAIRDYAAMRNTDPHEYPRYEVNGSMSTAMVSNRVSWFFDLKGPSISIDTACSSSLVGLHMAAKSIQSGESETALVGGTNLILMPETSNHLSTLTFLSPDSKSKAFDASANGYARGEGVCVLVVKSLAASLRDGDCIRAVIRGTSVNHDGRTPGINLPSASAQEDLIKTAYLNSGLSFGETGYFEAHGTGTAAGDPLEMEAVGRVFASSRLSGKPLHVGSVKTNIGHLEAAAGLAGLIKSMFMLEKGQIPPSLWLETLNHKIHAKSWGLTIPTELIHWPAPGLRRASVNSFGYGGTNAHCILDDAYHFLASRGLKGKHNTIVSTVTEAFAVVASTPVSSTPSLWPSSASESIVSTPPTESSAEIDGGGGPVSETQILVWSSHRKDGVSKMAEVLRSHMLEDSFTSIGSDCIRRLAYTLSNHRSRLPWMSFVLASDISSAVHQLTNPPRPVRKPSSAPALVFVFTGQGAQWPKMGRELMTYRTYRNSLHEASRHLQSLGCEWDLLQKLNDTCINEPYVSQPACTAVQVALIDLLAEWGVRPAAVVGHSSGEIAAAYAMGALRREDAWKIAYYRGVLSSQVATSGEMGMLAVGLGEACINQYIDKVETKPKPVVACINSPYSVTVSGSVEALTEMQKLIGNDAFNRRLSVKTAYHSPYMEQVAAPYLEALSDVCKHPPDDEEAKQGCAMYSSVTGKHIDAAVVKQPQYWVDNMVCPVRFLDALDVALSEYGSGYTALVEIGPHSALKGPIQQIISANALMQSQNVTYTTLLRRSDSAIETCLYAMGTLLQQGYEFDIAKLNCSEQLDSILEPPSHLVDLPPFSWNHSMRFWYETPRTRAYRLRKEPRHDLLGTLDESCTEAEPVWNNYIRVSEVPWLRHNILRSKTILPFSAILSMVSEGMKRTANSSSSIEGYQFRDVFPGPPLALEDSDDASVETRVAIRKWRAGSRSLTTYWNEFTVASRDRTGTWTQHSTGLVSIKYSHSRRNEAFADEDAAWAEKYRREHDQLVDSHEWKSRQVEEFYETFSKLGMHWGEAYQPVSTLSCRESGSIVHGSLQVCDTKAMMPEKYESSHIVHPTLLEGAIQLVSAIKTSSKDKIRVVKYIESIYVSSSVPTHPGARLDAYGRMDEKWADGTNSTVVVLDEAHARPLLALHGLKTVDAEPDVDVDAEKLRALSKLGAYLEWDVDVENTAAGSVKGVLQKIWDSAPRADYAAICDLEWASYILCKRTIETYCAKYVQTMAPHHETYCQWMSQQMQRAAAGELPCQTQDWISTCEATESQILERAASVSLEGKLLVRILENMGSILEGSMEPWELMNGDGLLNDVYRSGLLDEKTPAVLCEMIRRLSHKRPLRILEVGAGTGGATSQILKQLHASRVVQYTYTDISASFFSHAAEEFATWASNGIMDFKVFNVEKDPEEQNLDLASYDVVIAFQVLHATARMDKTLANCRKLLKTGGHLVVTELTSKVARRSAVFGVLEGWWLGEEDGRRGGPEMLEGEWDLRLRRQGFSGVDWSFRDRDDGGWSSSVMASRVVEPVEDAVDYRFACDRLCIVTSASPSVQTQVLLAEVSTMASNAGVLVEQTPLTSDLLEKEHLESFQCLIAVEMDSPLLARLEDHQFDALKRVLLRANSTIWLTASSNKTDYPNVEAAMITGLARTLRGEVPNLKLSTLDLDATSLSSSSASSAPVISRAEMVVKIMGPQHQADGLDHEFFERGGALYVPRIVPNERLSAALSTASSSDGAVASMQPVNQVGRPLRLELNKTGDLDDLVFKDDDSFFATTLGEEEVEVEVKAVGLDHYDMAVASGQIWDTVLGNECSGVVTRIGSRVDGFAIGDRVTCFSLSPYWYKTVVRACQGAVQRLPDDMAFEQGAGLARSIGAVLYGLERIGRLEQGDSVLIIDATSSHGQVALQLAQHASATVFATASNNEEKQDLIDKGVYHDYIFDHKDAGFAHGINRVTNQRGVDVIINTAMTGEMLRQSWQCIAPFGRFIELGMKDIRSNTGLDMTPFAANATFTGVNMKCMFFSNPKLFSQVMSQAMSYLKQGVIKASPLHLFKLSETAEAFRVLQSRGRLGEGRVVLNVDDQDMVLVQGERRKSGLQLRQDATYLVPGGLGGLGRVLLSRMASRGARNIVTVSRSGAKTAEAQEVVARLRSAGTRVEIFTGDISDESELRAILAQVAERGLPPIRGVIICAMSVRDAMFENMTNADFQASIRSKYNVTRNLHHLLPDQAQCLDFFICLSSAAGQIGSIAQGNYNAGNVYQDALCRHRKEVLGLPGTSIDLGWMSEIGFVAEAEVANVPQIVRDGVRNLNADQFLAIMDAAMSGEEQGQPILGLATGGLLRYDGAEYSPYWFSDARFGILANYDSWQTTTRAQQQDAAEYSAASTKTALAACNRAEEATAIVLTGLTSKIAKSLRMAPEEIDQSCPLNTYGVDSLVAVDIRAWAAKDMLAVIHVSDILKSEPMVRLAEKIAQASALVLGGSSGGQ